MHSTGVAAAEHKLGGSGVPVARQQGLGGHLPCNRWCVTNLPSEADKILILAFYSRKKERGSDQGSEISFRDKAGFAMLISFP